LALLLFAFAWTSRAMAAAGIDRELFHAEETLASRLPIWLFPLRDLMSMTVSWPATPAHGSNGAARSSTRRPFRQPCPSRKHTAMMKTLFLQPPSFDGFDGGAGSRYQAKREIKSFWFPTWLAQPAALVDAAS